MKQATKRSAYQQLKADYAMSLDGDNWGSAMQFWFGIAAELYSRDADIPAHWEYSPGCASDPREKDNWFYETLQAYSSADLLRFGNVLERYTRMLKHYGKDY